MRVNTVSHTGVEIEFTLRLRFSLFVCSPLNSLKFLTSFFFFFSSTAVPYLIQQLYILFIFNTFLTASVATRNYLSIRDESENVFSAASDAASCMRPSTRASIERPTAATEEKNQITQYCAH